MSIDLILYALALIVLFILCAVIGFGVLVYLFPQLRADHDSTEAINWRVLNDSRVTQHLPHHTDAAIRAYRQLTGADFDTAQRAVDHAIAKMDIPDAPMSDHTE